MTEAMGPHDPNETPEPVTLDRSMVDRCFGCGHANEEGLQLTFHRYSDGTVETRHSAAAHHCGVDEVVHGGIQATVLDEVMGVAAQLSLPEDASDLVCVTAEMNLRYRRPVPMDTEVVARAKLTHVEGRDMFVVGGIIDGSGEVLTDADSRWRQLRPR